MSDNYKNLSNSKDLENLISVKNLKLEDTNRLLTAHRAKMNHNLLDYDFSIRNLNYSKTNFSDLALPFSTFKNLCLKDCDFSNSNLQSADFSNAKLNNSNFEGTDCRTANFSYSNLRGVSFKGAILRKANLSKADLRGADLSTAIIKHANFTGAIYDATTIFKKLRDDARKEKMKFIGVKISRARYFSKNTREEEIFFFADNLARLRSNSGISLRGLGKIVGVSASTLGKYEAGVLFAVKTATVQKIADEFNVEVGSFRIKYKKKRLKIVKLKLISGQSNPKWPKYIKNKRTKKYKGFTN